jgi:DHA1 family inner membrane transport protein
VILAVLMVCSFAVATAEFVLVGLLPQIAADVSVSVAAAGQLVTLYMLVVTVGGPVATVLTRRLPRRGLLAGTMALATGAASGSALAGSYGVLLASRVGSALAQALFMAVASQVAMAASAPERQPAAVARVFGGFAVATVVGLPVGTLVGGRFGWHATFVVVAVLAGAGLLGVLVWCPAIPATDAVDALAGVRRILRPPVVRGLAVTLFTLTGFVAVFTYVTPMLRTVPGAGPLWVSLALVGYGLGTVAGNVLAGRVPAHAVAQVLPVPIAGLTLVLLLQPALLQYRPLAATGLVLVGLTAFVVVPLVQTWLMAAVGPQGAALAASVNVSVAGVAGALGAGLGGAVLAAGVSPVWINPLAAVPVSVAAVIAARLRHHDRRPLRSREGEPASGVPR